MNIIMKNGHEPEYGRMLNERMLEAFGFSFAPWFALDQWDERYESYSIVKEGRMLSNVCVLKTELLICGKPVPALQIGGVSTAKDCQGRGYMRAIMEHILGKYPDMPVFLHANQSVTQFYPRFGFRRVWEHQPTLDVRIDNGIAPVKLRWGDEVLTRALGERGAFSGILDARHTQTVQVFHLIMDQADNAYHIPELDAIVLAEQREGVLRIADVIAKRPLSFDILKRHLPFANVRRVAFGFSPDWLSVAPDWSVIKDDDEALFVRGEWNLPAAFKFPDTSMT